MLNIIEYQILNSCADDWETFYYPFAEINYGGQILAAFGGRGQPYQRGDEPREIKISGEIIAGHVRALIHAGLLQCLRVFGDHERAEMTEPEELEFAVYDGYDCLTWQEHTERFGYGPHEFRATEAGIEEIGRSIYEQYDEELGWK